MEHSKLPYFQCAVMLCLFFMVSASILYLSFSRQYTASDELAGLRFAIYVLLAPILVKYVIQLAVLPFYCLVDKRRQAKGLKENQLDLAASVSVLIPAWNEEVGIIKTLRSVINTNYTKLDVIVINDGSTDATHQLVTEFIQKYESRRDLTITLRYLPVKNGGKAKALNQGLAMATGDIVITVDADCVMDRKAIDNLLLRFTDDQVAAVAGNVIVGNRKKPIELIQQLEYLYGFFFKRADAIFNSVYIVGGAAAAYRKRILLELGGFDDDIITEDIEMSTRILAHGYKSRYAADAVVFTEGPSELQGLCNQRLRWKFGRLLTFVKHKNLFFSTSKQHSSYLAFLLLPVAVYAEFTLLIEGPLLTIFYGYTFYTDNYFPLVFMMGFICALVSIQIIFDAKSRFHRNLFLLAPVAWIIFYLIDIVEFQALYRSLKRFVKRENLQWQQWVRVGVLSKSVDSDTADSDGQPLTNDSLD